MKITQLHMSPDATWLKCSRANIEPGSDLALVFWSEADDAKIRDAVRGLRLHCPEAIIAGCSTGGVIQDRLVMDNAVSATLINFEHTQVRAVSGAITDFTDAGALGRFLASALPHQDLAHVLVFSDGLFIDGCELSAGITSVLPESTPVSGGLAADGERFQHTSVLHDGQIISQGAVCVGLYGSRLRTCTGTGGGWEPFGPERLITAAENCTLFELDGESALELYERYLGKHAQNLPASGHLFPLNVRESEGKPWVTRSVMGMDRNRHALFFGGKTPVGSTAQLMRGSIDSLLEGAATAATKARLEGAHILAILVSCVGRKILLKQFIEDEVDAVASILGPQTALTGFYSYGEIAPAATGQSCTLHNQTMTVTVLVEE